jgi:hypothetical protein
MTVQAGQTIRLRIGSETTVRFFRPASRQRRHEHGADSVGSRRRRERLFEGARRGRNASVSTGYDKGEVLLIRDRVDVVATFPATATGVFTLWTKSFVRQGSGGPTLPTVPVAHFKINGSIEPRRPSPTARRFCRRPAPAPKSRCSARRRQR